MEDDDPIISAEQLRAVGFCFSGQMKWFRSQGLDARAHFARGTPQSVLAATGDGFALRAIELLKGRRDGK